ncbi:hypothetical protein AMS68_004196 [Peltaster fructicola]|uniref:SGNH hydrolase-type esterase domain-containing protein n=1 Tax=Peltaster fructicola TaxID=286661 RepID=A0A6H0XVN5_9PEZI|nr:hypothetical protein AMS68_004196 [Peltaster fructicola]
MALRSVVVALCLGTYALSSSLPSFDPHVGALIPRVFPADFQLKVLCLGDSITVGIGDGHPILQGLNNGYRLDLYNFLMNAGVSPQFVGSQVSGTDNPQPHNEGYGGAVINYISDQLKAGGSLAQQPNLILIHAGTNDNDYEDPTNPATLHSGTPGRLGDMLDYILHQAPNAVVLVAQIIQNKNFNGTAQVFTNDFNAAIPGIVAQRCMRGFKVRVVDMSMIGGDEMMDALHPLPQGYQDMANRWSSAILGIPGSWWSTSSSGATGATLEHCARDTATFSPALCGNVVGLGLQANGDVLLCRSGTSRTLSQPGLGYLALVFSLLILMVMDGQSISGLITHRFQEDSYLVD